MIIQLFIKIHETNSQETLISCTTDQDLSTYLRKNDFITIYSFY